jgi:Delta7-sterol 5-desaturase
MNTFLGALDLKQFLVFQVVTQSFRYALVAGGAYLVFWRFFANRMKGRATSFNSVTASQIRRELFWSASSMLCFVLIGLFIYLAARMGWVRIYSKVSEHGVPYWIGSLLLLMLAHETYFYFIHRAMHHPWLFKRVHGIHHDSLNPSPFTSLSFHPLEAFLEALVVPGMLLFMPLHWGVLLIFQFTTLILNVNGHLGFELYPKDHETRPILRWINTATLHGHHHKAFNCNYGLYTTFWDRLLGTLVPVPQRKKN